MLFNYVLFSTMATLGVAFRIPEGTPDGVYRAYYNITGHQVLELITDSGVAGHPGPSQFSSRIKRGEAELVNRQLTKRGQTWCGCNFGMDHGDCDAANADLRNLFNPGYNIGNHNGVIAVRGSAAAFACNYATYNVQLFSGTQITGAQHVTSACGWYIAGTWQVDGFDHVDYGYMNYDNQDVCAHAEGSGSHSC